MKSIEITKIKLNVKIGKVSSNEMRISQSSISKIERGLKMISIKEAKALGKALDVRPQFSIAGE